MSQQGLPKPPLHDESLQYQWREWLRRLYVRAAEAGQILWAQLDFTGSNLTDLTTRLHRDLQGLQGGAINDYYHLTAAQHDTLTDGSNADDLHIHDIASGSDALVLNEDDALITDGDFNAIYTED